MPSAVRTDLTADRLLAVAERLFAEHGVDAVSVRAITIEAGANIAAVHYHFGTKVDLVRALVERRVDEVNRSRAARLRELESASHLAPRDLAAVWIEPLAELALDPERRAYLGFLVSLHGASPELRALSSEVFRPHFPRLDAALSRALPDVDVAVRRFRFKLATEMSMRALAALDQLDAAWRSERRRIGARALVDEITDAFTGLLLGAPRTGHERTTSR